MRRREVRTALCVHIPRAVCMLTYNSRYVNARVGLDRMFLYSQLIHVLVCRGGVACWRSRLTSPSYESLTIFFHREGDCYMAAAVADKHILMDRAVRLF